IVLLQAAAMIGFSTLRELRRSLAGGAGYDGPRSDHFDGRHFFNPEAPAGRSFRDLLRWHRTAQRRPWPQWVENRARPALPAHLEAGQLALTFINHITFLIQLGGRSEEHTSELQSPDHLVCR